MSLTEQNANLAPTPASDLLPAPVQDLRLELLDGDQPGPVIRIRGKRCTLGGAQSCSIRLRGLGILPVHCMILRRGDRWLIRSLSGRNTLNSEPFNRAQLRPGDTLRIGSVSLRVIRQSPPDQPEDADRGRRAKRARRKTATAATSPRRSRLEIAARLEQIEKHLANSRCSHADPASIIAAHEAESSLRKISQLETELNLQREMLDLERKNWSDERQRLGEQLSEQLDRLNLQESQLSSLRSNVEELINELDAASVANELARQEWQDEKAELAEQWYVSTDQAKFDLAEQTQSSEQWRTQCSELELQLEARQSELAHHQTQTQELREIRDELTQRLHEQCELIDQLRNRCERLETIAGQAAEPHAGLSTDGSSINAAAAIEREQQAADPVEREYEESDPAEQVPIHDSPSFAPYRPYSEDSRFVSETSAYGNDETAFSPRYIEDDLVPSGDEVGDEDEVEDFSLTRLEHVGVWQDENTDGLPADGTAIDAPGTLANDRDSAAQSETLSDSPADEDESIESYMNRLMVRLRGPETASQYVFPSAAENAQPAPASSEPEQDRLEAMQLAQEELPAADFRPRSPAPELTAKLAAMRALANDSARAAIANHKVRHKHHHLVLHLMTASATIFIAACVMLKFKGDPILFNAAMIIALAAGGYGFGRYFSFRAGGRRNSARSRDSHAADEIRASRITPTTTPPLDDECADDRSQATAV